MADKKKEDRRPSSADPRPDKAGVGATEGRQEAGDSPREADRAPTAQAESPVDEAAELKAKLEEALVAAKRWQAEFVNYQARAARDREADRKYASDGLLRELLPAMDTLQHSIGLIAKADAAPTILEAMRLVEKELLRVLGKFGVKPIEAQSQPFDPGLHEAFSVVETSDHPDGAVVEVLRPGYMLHERVLRPAQVRVARRPGP